MPDISLFDQEVKAGEKRVFRAPVGEMNDGTPVSVPVMVVAGRDKGPTVFLGGAAHGDEYAGPAAIPRLFNELSADQVRGTLIGIPILNPFAYFARARSNVLDYEHLNLNRIWPGDPKGYLSQRMAHHLFQEAIRGADAILDIHEGGIAFIARYMITDGTAEMKRTVGERQLQMARWFGGGVPVNNRTISEEAARMGRLGTLSAAAGAIGIPVLTVEIGGGGTLWPDYVDLVVDGSRRVLRGLGAIEGEVGDIGPEQIIVSDAEWPRPKRGGLLRAAPGIEVGQVLEAGVSLATIHDVFGEVVEELVTPFRCVILDTRFLATIYPGDWTYHCGRIED